MGEELSDDVVLGPFSNGSASAMMTLTIVVSLRGKLLCKNNLRRAVSSSMKGVTGRELGSPRRKPRPSVDSARGGACRRYRSENSNS